MVGDVDRDVEAARHAAARPDLALVGEADLVPLVDAGGDRDPQAPASLGAPLAPAGLARVLDDLPLAPAARARGDVHHLPEHRLADRPDLAAALALGALHGRGAGLGTRALA